MNYKLLCGPWLLATLLIPMVSYAQAPYCLPPSCNADQELFPIQFSADDTRKVYIDVSGAIRINKRFDKAYEFAEGLASVRLGGNAGYIDPRGNFVIDPIFEQAGSFENGYAIAKLKGRYGVIDKQGAWVIDPIFDEISRTTHDVVGLTLGNRTALSRIDSGKKFDLRKLMYFPRLRYSDSRFMEVRNEQGLYGYFDKEKMKLVVEPQFKDAYNIVGPYVGAVTINNKNVVLNLERDGKYLFSPSDKKIIPSEGPLFWYKQGGFFGAVDENKKIVVPFIYKNTCQYYFGQCANRDNKGDLVILDKSGRKVSGNLNHLTNIDRPISNDLLWASIGNRSAIVNKQGEFIVQPVIDGESAPLNNFKNGVWIITRGSGPTFETGLLKEDGTWAVEFGKYRSIDSIGYRNVLFVGDNTPFNTSILSSRNHDRLMIQNRTIFDAAGNVISIH